MVATHSFLSWGVSLGHLNFMRLLKLGFELGSFYIGKNILCFKVSREFNKIKLERLSFLSSAMRGGSVLS